MNYNCMNTRALNIAKRTVGLIATGLALMIIMLFVATRPVSAVNTEAAYELTKYDVTTVVNKDHTYQVIQKISVNLPSDLTQLSFIIPKGNFKSRI